jgi:hypothetical protein
MNPVIQSFAIGSTRETPVLSVLLCGCHLLCSSLTINVFLIKMRVFHGPVKVLRYSSMFILFHTIKILGLALAIAHLLVLRHRLVV